MCEDLRKDKEHNHIGVIFEVQRLSIVVLKRPNNQLALE